MEGVFCDFEAGKQWGLQDLLSIGILSEAHSIWSLSTNLMKNQDLHDSKAKRSKPCPVTCKLTIQRLLRLIHNQKPNKDTQDTFVFQIRKSPIPWHVVPKPLSSWPSFSSDVEWVAIWRQLVMEACPIPAEITASYSSNGFTYVFLKESVTFFKDKQVWSCQPSPFSGPLADPVASPRCFSPNSGPPANRIGKILHLWAHHKENLLNLAACMNAM